METIKIKASKNPAQVTNCPTNFVVTLANYDQGDPVGNGATLQLAVHDFMESYLLKYDEEVKVEIVNLSEIKTEAQKCLQVFVETFEAIFDDLTSTVKTFEGVRTVRDYLSEANWENYITAAHLLERDLYRTNHRIREVEQYLFP